MSNTISGGISFSGIGSGTDFNAMLEQLKEVESFRLYSLQDSRDDASETYEAFQDLLKTVTEAQDSLSLLNSYEEFLTKIASSSNEATLGVKADAHAVDGTHKIEVTQLASNAIWANKNTYADKTTVINSTGAAQDFSYTYEGETRTLSVPAGTTLEGFANMINQDKANPGVNVSILKVANGYTFQMSGDASGESASLEIHPSGLMGLSGAGGTWESSGAVDLTAPLNGAQSTDKYTYTLNMRSGGTITVPPASPPDTYITGDMTNQELVAAINAAAGSDIARIGSDGVMSIDGLDSMSVQTIKADGTTTTQDTDVVQETTLSLAGGISELTYTGPKTYTFGTDPAGGVTISMDSNHTQKDILDALKAEGYNYTAKMNAGRTEVTISGITDASDLVATDANNYTPQGVISSFTMPSGSLTSATLSPMTYTFENADGHLISVDMTGTHAPEDVLNELQNQGYAWNQAITADGKTEIAVQGIKDLSIFGTRIPDADPNVSYATINLSDSNGAAALPPQTYTFTKSDGTTINIDMTADHTQDDILAALRVDGYESIVTEQASGRYSIAIAGLSDISALYATDANRGTPATSSTAYAEYTEEGVDPNATLQSNLVPLNMTLTFTKENGDVVEYHATNDQTMQDILNDLNGPPYNITSRYDSATQKLSFEGITSVAGIPGSVPISGSLTGSDAWQVQAAQDARFKVDNWPQELTSSSNEVTGVLEGITLSLRDVGTAQITVAADTDSVKANIQTVLDAFNSVLKKIQDLTAITEDVADSYDDTGQSLSNTQGSALTGNYSTLLFASRFKAAISSNPPGFQPMQADDIFSGDLISGLAQLGIKVSTDEDDPNFGLFAIAPSGTTDAMQALDQATFDKAIAENLEEVISFFASDSVGRSSSPNFRYSNHIDGITSPGTYNVSYSVNASGVATDVFINGARAAASETDPNTFTVGSEGGDASGMSITIDNLAAGSYTGSVSVQQGKVGQMEDFLAAELVYVEPKLSDPALGNENGGLKIAEQSFADLITGLDNKISEESDRLDRWYETERLKFARLDTLLGTYNGQMEMLTQQLAQLA